MDLKSRLRNKAFWVSLAACIALIAKTFNLFEIPDNYDQLVSAILSVFVMSGVIIDPTTPGIKDGEMKTYQNI